MEVLENISTKGVKIPNRDSQLRRLERNQRDITQLFRKLSSYVCEPRTYEQYKQLNSLKDSVKELRDSNNTICRTLRFETNATVRCFRLLKAHIQNFEVFAKAMSEYLQEVKVHDTAHV